MPQHDDSTVRSEALAQACEQALAERESAGLRRTLQAGTPHGRHLDLDGRHLLNLASNDYLGLSDHPRLIAAAVEAVQRFGVGAGASRLVSGTWPIHRGVEQSFAAFKHAEAALVLPTGYTANLAVLTTLAGPGDLIVLDKLVHASLIDAARASGAMVMRFAHLRLNHAAKLLQRSVHGKRLIVTDSVFSMDGDCADLPALCDLADRFDAVVVVDEAHGTGVLGGDGSGLAMAQGVAERVYTCGAGGVVVSTASKALGSLGGLITSHRAVIDLLINKARPFIYSTAVPPAQAAAIEAALQVIRDEPERRDRLARIARDARARLAAKGWPVAIRAETGVATPIIPLIVGGAEEALALAARLRGQGVFAPAIRPPTVAPGSARVRLSLRADLTDDDLTLIVDAVGTPARD